MSLYFISVKEFEDDLKKRLPENYKKRQNRKEIEKYNSKWIMYGYEKGKEFFDEVEQWCIDNKIDYIRPFSCQIEIKHHRDAMAVKLQWIK